MSWIGAKGAGAAAGNAALGATIPSTDALSTVGDRSESKWFALPDPEALEGRPMLGLPVEGNDAPENEPRSPPLSLMSVLLVSLLRSTIFSPSWRKGCVSWICMKGCCR